MRVFFPYQTFQIQNNENMNTTLTTSFTNILHVQQYDEYGMFNKIQKNVHLLLNLRENDYIYQRYHKTTYLMTFLFLI